MGISEINYLLSKMVEEGKGALESLELIEKSGLFSEEALDEWFENFKQSRQSK